MLRLLLLCSCLFLFSTSLNAKEYRVTLTAENRDYTEIPLTVALPEGKISAPVKLVDSTGKSVACRLINDGRVSFIRWIERDLKKGESRTYRLQAGSADKNKGDNGIEVIPAVTGAEIRVRGALFTRLQLTGAPNKPVFYPLYAPGGKLIVRKWPMEKSAGETNDHPHHRGLWFTHGAVDGVDYWTEDKGTGYTSGKLIGQISQHDQVCATLDYLGEWRPKQNSASVLTDTRAFTVWNTHSGILVDWQIVLKSKKDNSLLFGDTKEGSLGLRVADSMRLAGGDGRILNSNGDKDGKTWGKRADWVDYSGSVDGQTVGITIMDMPDSFRHPTWWHVRDYGLFAANPFGRHDFEKDQPPKAGDYLLKDESLTFHYMLFIHKGNAEQSQVAELWSALNDLPKVSIK